MLSKLIFLMFSLTLLGATQPTYENVTKLYVATFNRAPDTVGLNYWINDSFNGNPTLSQIAQSFFDQKETQTLYPAGTSNRDFVRSVYLNLFNREPDSVGWNYWEQELNQQKYSKNRFIETVINGATDDANGMDKTILENKKEAGLYFALYGNEDKNLASSIMQTITSDANTVTQVRDTLYADSGTSANDVCILDIIYDDKSTVTLCYEGVSKYSCELSSGSDNESDWYGFPLKGECLALGYPQSSQTLDNSNHVFYGMTGLFTRSIEAGDKESTHISEDNLVAQSEGAKISFSPNDIEGDKTVTIQKTSPKKLSPDEEIDDDYQILSYDFILDGKTDFIDLIEITLPYDESFIKTAGDESGSVMAKYYNPSSGKYEPVDYEVDTINNEVKILTDHLSEYAIFVLANGERHGAFKVINNNSRQAYITATDAYYKFVDSSNATDIINAAIANNMNGDIQSYEAGFSAANEWLGLLAAGNGLSSAPFSSSFLTTLGNSFNHLGFGASVLQAAVDFGNGDNTALFSNLSKNIVYNLVNYAGTSALQLSFVGVFAIDYSLNKFGTEALSELEKKWKKIYDYCYNEDLKKTNTQWYKTFKDLQERSENPSRLSDMMYTTVYNNVYSGWKDYTQMSGCAADIGMSYNALGTLTNDIKESISREKFYELIESLQGPVFDQLRKKTVYKLRAEHKKQLEIIRNNLNKVINVQIQETVNSGEIAGYAGYRFRFAPLNAKANKAEWTGTLNSTGGFTGAWRVLGYMQAGSPDRLELFKPTDNPDTATPVKTIEFTTTPPNLLINFESGTDTRKTFSGSRESTYAVKYSDLIVNTNLQWNFKSTTDIKLNDPIIYLDDEPINVDDDGSISLWFSTKWTSNLEPSGTFSIDMGGEISGSVDDGCTIGKPYYRLNNSGSSGMFSGHDPEFNFQLDGSTVVGNYKFTSGGNTVFFSYNLRIPITCDGDTEIYHGPDIYMRIEN